MDNNIENAILVWDFDDAPEKYQKMSTNGGDEDYIFLVPNSFIEKHGIPWWFSCSALSPGRDDPQPIKLDNGDVIFIFTHA